MDDLLVRVRVQTRLLIEYPIGRESHAGLEEKVSVSDLMAIKNVVSVEPFNTRIVITLNIAADEGSVVVAECVGVVAKYLGDMP